MKPTTIASLQKCKQEKKRFATITAYDYSFAKLFADEGLNVMLVGDSLGMTVQGHDSTLPVTVADIAYHTAAVRRGAPNCLLLADLPFMAYATPEQAFENAATVMRAGAGAANHYVMLTGLNVKKYNMAPFPMAISIPLSFPITIAKFNCVLSYAGLTSARGAFQSTGSHRERRVFSMTLSGHMSLKKLTLLCCGSLREKSLRMSEL